MRIQGISIKNVLGVSDAEIATKKPATLIAGKNGAGKSSIREAIRQALIGEPGRAVEHKKDFGLLIHNGAEFGGVTVEFDGGLASIVLPKGDRKIEGKIDGADTLRLCIDPEAFAKLDSKERRAILFDLMAVRITPAAVKDRLVKRGIDMAKAERALPLLAAGFDSANSEAKAKARDAKASWKTATGGETWGKDKAAKWEPKPLEVPADEAARLMAGASATAEAIDTDLADVQAKIGEGVAIENQRKANAAKRAELNEKASKAERYGNKLAIDEGELAAWEQKVAETKAKAGVAPNPKAPGEYLLRGLATVAQDFLALSCEYPDVQWPNDLITRASMHVQEFRKAHGEPSEQNYDPEAAAKLPEYEKALSLLRSAVDNGRRNVREAIAAGEALGALGTDPSPVDVDGLKAKASELDARRRAARAEVEKYRRIVEAGNAREATIKAAADLHDDVLAWEEIARAFAPDGIQSEFLADAIRPFNTTLAEVSDLAQWALVSIDADMQIIVGGRPYAFRSESEKWRADAIIAASVAIHSGLRFVMLDRFDVLDGDGRAEALYWIDDMIADGHIESAVIFGTLKAMPNGLPGNIGAAWIEAGRIEAEAA